MHSPKAIVAKFSQLLTSFVRARRGGAMLVACAFVLTTAFGAGALMTNYAWREAQEEELIASLRAAISSAGALLTGVKDAAVRQQIQERVAGFAKASNPGLTLGANDVTVAFDATSRTTTISVAGSIVFSGIFALSDGPVSATAINTDVVVRIEIDRYEVAVAVDVSGSMRNSIPGEIPGTTVVKLDKLKSVMLDIARIVDESTKTTPGSFLVSVVPFTAGVNVADTATDGPVTNKRRTAAKEQYVRMLAGMPGDGETIADTLAAARKALADGGGHWVDTFHHYGIGSDLGPLRKQGLPSDLLNDVDWNLRRQNVEIDVRARVPSVDTGATSGRGWWLVNDEDFWNGCLMARWGAYWNTSARPQGWDPNDADNWPANKAVESWTTGGTALPATTPLHLSDAPPEADDPHSLFTAYSWPDARIGGYADYRLVLIMTRLLDRRPTAFVRSPPGSATMLNHLVKADNDWSVARSRRGAGGCPHNPITPLSDELSTLRKAVTDLDIPLCSTCNFPIGTYVNRGVVWALRSLSPLWQQVWQITDGQGLARPAIPCAPGESEGACMHVNKSILIVSDGGNFPQDLVQTRLGRADPGNNPVWTGDQLCSSLGRSYIRRYHRTAVQTDEARFNADFNRHLSSGTFGGGNMSEVVDAFRILDRVTTDTPARRNARQAQLDQWTPWQLFRGTDAGVVDALMDENNGFGFEGRPVQMEGLCRPSSAHGPYGRLDDHIFVGNSSTQPGMELPPVPDAAPFSLAGMPNSMVGDHTPGSGNYRSGGVLGRIFARLDDWTVDACDIAGQRGVQINAVYIGNHNRQNRLVRLLESCVDAAGGDPNVNDVFVTPNAKDLEDAFAEMFVTRRRLRFLN